MTDSQHDDALLADLEAQNRSIDFPAFTHADAYAVGSDLVRRGTEGGLPIAISILFGEQRVFHAALAGSSADNDDWLARKLRVVARFGIPSLLFETQVGAAGLAALPHLDPSRYAAAGGAFPLRVNGTLIGGVAVSGLTSREDHDLVVAALEAARQG